MWLCMWLSKHVLELTREYWMDMMYECDGVYLCTFMCTRSDFIITCNPFLPMFIVLIRTILKYSLDMCCLMGLCVHNIM